jgi:hypothetical protein
VCEEHPAPEIFRSGDGEGRTHGRATVVSSRPPPAASRHRHCAMTPPRAATLARSVATASGPPPAPVVSLLNRTAARAARRSAAVPPIEPFALFALARASEARQPVDDEGLRGGSGRPPVTHQRAAGWRGRGQRGDARRGSPKRRGRARHLPVPHRPVGPTALAVGHRTVPCGTRAAPSPGLAHKAITLSRSTAPAKRPPDEVRAACPSRRDARCHTATQIRSAGPGLETTTRTREPTIAGQSLSASGARGGRRKRRARRHGISVAMATARE